MSQSGGKFAGKSFRNSVSTPGASNGGATENGKIPATAGQQTNPTPTTQPTDSYIPTYMSELVPELRSYEQLKDSERKVDVYLARKRIDLQQNVSQWNNSKSPTTT